MPCQQNETCQLANSPVMYSTEQSVAWCSILNTDVNLFLVTCTENQTNKSFSFFVNLQNLQIVHNWQEVKVSLGSNKIPDIEQDNTEQLWIKIKLNRLWYTFGNWNYHVTCHLTKTYMNLQLHLGILNLCHDAHARTFCDPALYQIAYLHYILYCHLQIQR